METKELLRLGNYVIEHVVEDEMHSAIVMRDISSTWEMRVRSTNPIYQHYLRFAEEIIEPKIFNDEQVKLSKCAYEATVVILHSLSTIGLHDVSFTNRICEAMEERNKMYSECMNKDVDQEREVKDAEAWMESEQVLEDMQQAIEEEEHNG